MTLELGSQLGPYEIESAAGAGGMGEVYRAKDTRLDRWVAIKILPAALSQDQELRARFEREAKTISSLSHPHICSLYDIGQHEGADYLVMEYCEGETLAERLKNGPLSTDQLFRYGTQIGYALDKAHRQGIVHRDLKPGNVMLTREGAKLLDFGLAKYSDVGSGSGSQAVDSMTALPTEHQPLTEAGTLLGTFQYMAPEQLEGKEADARADIFAFGALLYEMATGKPAFAGDSRASLIAAILERQPTAVSVAQPMAPPAMDHVIKRCLEKDPEDRWQSAHDVARQLEWIAEGGSQIGVAAPVVSKRKSRERWAWTLAALGLILGALGLGLAFSGSQPKDLVSKSHILPPDGTSFDFNGINSGSLAVSPSGRLVAFTAPEENGDRFLWIRSVDSLEPRKLSGTEGAEHLFWSPDSHFVAFFADGKLRKVDISGAPPLAVCDATNGRSGSWNEDGIILFSPNTLDGIHRVDAAGGEPQAVTTVDADQGETTHRWAHFLPDGKRFLYMAAGHALGTTSEFNAVYAGSLETDEKSLIVRARSNVVYSQGHLLYVREGVLIAHPFDPDRLEMVGDPFPITSQTRYSSGYFRGVFSASPNGVLVFQTGTSNPRTQLAWLDRQGNQVELVGEPDSYQSYDLSPDETKLAVEIQEEGTGTSDLWIWDLARDVKSRFTFGELSEFAPIWSNDGSQISYSAVESASKGAQWDIWIKHASGTQDSKKVMQGEKGEALFANSWSPDDQLLATTVFRSANDAEIGTVSLSGAGATDDFLARDFFDAAGQFSPDGRWMSFLSDESGKTELYVVPFPGPGGKWQISTSGADWGFWRDSEIVVQTPDSRLISVPFETTDSEFRIGAPQELFQNKRIDGVDISRDGQRFLVSLSPENVSNPPLVLVTDWTADLAD